MIIITLILINTIWIAYALAEGVEEGFYRHYEESSKRVCNFNINPIFNLQRLLFLSVISFFSFFMFGWLYLSIFPSLVLTFRFFHNGIYFHTRNKLDNNSYAKGWLDEPKNPKLTLTTYKNRTITMIVGLIFQIFIYLFLI